MGSKKKAANPLPMLPVNKDQFDRLIQFDGKDVGPRQGPARKRQVVNSVMSVHDQGTPAEQREGSEWYPKVHDATAKGARRFKLDSTLHGAGVVAAVSPQMDWDNNNIHAFSELASLKQHHWDAIARSNAAGKRTAEVSDLLRGMSISRAPDSGLLKAHRIMLGEHPDSVLDPRSAPKTNSFAHNIADPSATVNPHTGRTLATIDGRAHDIGINRMLPWEADRGISSQAGARGGITRYEHFADAYGQAARIVSAEGPRDITPSEMQARTWVIGKRYEQHLPGAKMSGGKPWQGPPRVGQTYWRSAS